MQSIIQKVTCMHFAKDVEDTEPQTYRKKKKEPKTQKFNITNIIFIHD
jgi:hypothetical protein